MGTSATVDDYKGYAPKHRIHGVFDDNTSHSNSVNGLAHAQSINEANGTFSDSHYKGDFLIDASGRLTRGPGVVYGGIQILRTDALADISDTAFSLNKVWTLMSENKRLFGLVYTGQWCDVGTPQGIIEAEEMLGTKNV